MVLVAKRDKKRIYEHLLNEGVITVKKVNINQSSLPMLI